MSVLADVKSRLSALVRSEQDRYSGSAPQPLGGYLATMSVYSALVGTVAGLALLTGREIPDGLSTRDVVLHAVATHKLSRLLAKDPATSPLRAPFTEYEGTAGPSEVNEQARGEGPRRVVGELISSPVSADVWVATGLMAGLIYLPRTTRLAIAALAAVAGADMLQFAYAWLEEKNPSSRGLAAAAPAAGQPGRTLQ